MEGHIRQRGKNSWSIVIRGKWHTVRGTKEDAERERVRLLNQVYDGYYVEPSSLTVAQYLNRWLRDAAEMKLTRRSFERYSDVINLYIIPHIGTVKLSKLQPSAIQGLYAKLLREGGKRREGLSTETVRGVHVIFRAALKQAVRWQLLGRNPADAVDAPRKGDTEVVAVDERHTMTIIEAARGTRLYVPILLAVTAGMRRNEILALRWRDVDLHNSTIDVKRAAEHSRQGLDYKGPKTKHGKRAIALPPMAVEALKAHKAEQNQRRMTLGSGWTNQDLVCDRGDGRPYQPANFSTDFARFIDRNSLPDVTFHGLRHGHATHLIKAGVPANVVSRRLGHANIGITLGTYGHVMPGMQEDAALKLERALKLAKGKRR